MDALIPILFVGGFIAVAVLFIVSSMVAARKRREALREQAASLGCAFDETAVEPDAATYGRLPLFQRGRMRRVYNALSRSTDRGGELIVCDYRYTTGSGKNSHTYSCSTVLFRIPDARLPAFTLQPEHFLHKLIEFVGFKDIDFPEDEEFSRKIYLKGDDENALRAFFTPGVRAAVSAQTNWCVDGGGEWLALYRANHQAKPEEIGTFLEEARALAEFFAPRRTSSNW